MNKLLSLLSIGSTLANTTLLQRFLADITIVIALAAICGTIAGMVVIAVMYALYLTLMHYGLDTQTAVLTVSAVSILVIAILSAMAVARWRRLRSLPRHFVPLETPVVTHATEIMDAFIDGLRRAP